MQTIRRAPGLDRADPGVYRQLLDTMGNAKSVRTHRDFFEWLQGDVYNWIPHQTLLAAWGDFTRGELSYDVASSLHGLNTSMLASVRGLDYTVTRLFEAVSKSSRGWIFFNDFHRLARESGMDVDSHFYRTTTATSRGLLACAMRDERGRQDCLYVFSISAEHAALDEVVLRLLLPHLDSALRRVECLPPAATEQEQVIRQNVESLSDREHEVLTWVSQGKSNEEIGTILGISHNTVKNHLKRIFNKMGVTARSQAVCVYLQGMASNSR
ncbi:helix-turn-helix transcriptional regulator [Mangrovimicrobium sediminis]|uniref:Helix-turn-helix transcriptional regulator n=1 Tax=Mangrovimicrobium sediminis TaxID=2562682 RepID=A0A4Z0M846_9GAMM|nr:XrtB/PEP-CTERM-associated transcriptional regulator EpsA [Haliea sp. SAOS-164]TGD75701.1 helix-turn-helix transcriptional regulator [Haliea sp. SAOS-164]